MSNTQAQSEALRLAIEFSCYFTSGNRVDVGPRVSVPTAEWRALARDHMDAVMKAGPVA